MKYLLLLFGLFLSAQASWCGVLYTFTVDSIAGVPSTTFSFNEANFLTHTTTIAASNLENVAGLLPGIKLESVVISYLGGLIIVTENLNTPLPLVFGFADGAWKKVGTYDSFLDLSQMTISDSISAAPEPGQFGLLLAGGALVIGFWRRAANSSRKCRS